MKVNHAQDENECNHDADIDNDFWNFFISGYKNAQEKENYHPQNVCDFLHHENQFYCRVLTKSTVSGKCYPKGGCLWNE
jgi:hypothetical protein